MARKIQNSIKSLLSRTYGTYNFKHIFTPLARHRTDWLYFLQIDKSPREKVFFFVPYLLDSRSHSPFPKLWNVYLFVTMTSSSTLTRNVSTSLGSIIGIMVRVFANDPGELSSITGRVRPKFQKWYLMPPCLTLSIIMYGSRVKWGNPEKGVVPSPTPWCISNR